MSDEYTNLISNLADDLLELCKNNTISLCHPEIQQDKEYQILGFKECNGRYGEFFILYCFLPALNKYQRVFSNPKLTGEIYSTMPLWTSYEMDVEREIHVWASKGRMMKFIPGKLKKPNTSSSREFSFTLSKGTI